MLRKINLILILTALLAVSAEAKRTVVNEQGDTVQYLYPKFNGFTVNVDIFSPLSNAFGQKYGNYEASLDAGFYNRFYPIYEIGVCYGNDTPNDYNYTYHVNPSFYNRIGLNYNIMYNKNIPGMLFVGLRYGMSVAKYDIRNISISSSYWDDTQTGLTINGGRSVAHWGEMLIGLQMNAYRGFMIGWTLRYKILFTASQPGSARPWIIPGFGKRNNPLGFTFTIGYRISPKKKQASSTPEEAVR